MLPIRLLLMSGFPIFQTGLTTDYPEPGRRKALRGAVGAL